MPAVGEAGDKDMVGARAKLGVRAPRDGLDEREVVDVHRARRVRARESAVL